MSHSFCRNLQVNDRVTWRDAIESGNYDPQNDEFPSRTPTPRKKVEVDANFKEENDNDDDNAVLVVKDLSRALLQISKCVESRFLGPPLGKKLIISFMSFNENHHQDSHSTWKTLRNDSTVYTSKNPGIL